MAGKKSQELIDQIGQDLKDGMAQTTVGRKYKVSQQFVRKVKHGVAEAKTDIKIEKADPTDQRILQLEARELAYKDDVRRLKLAYRAAQRENSIFEAVASEMRNFVTPIKPLPKASRKGVLGKQISESLVMHLSDGHHDSIVLPHQVAGLERHDFNIALRRAEEYVDATIKFTQKTLTNYDFHTLWILAYGDHTSGEIHGAVDHSHYRNQFRNCLAIGQMHALMYRDLASHFPEVHILYLPGNHGRRTPRKEYHSPRNNWDYLIAEIAKQHCSDLTNVDFLIPDSFSANIEIEKFGFCVSHGDDIKSYKGLPWYGIERKVRRWTALNAAVDRKIDYYCLGHFHNCTTLANLNGEILINGSWIGVDPYGYNSLTGWNKPTQILHGVHRDRGISWRLHINLRSPREHLGPQRYSVLLAKDLL